MFSSNGKDIRNFFENGYYPNKFVIKTKSSGGEAANFSWSYSKNLSTGDIIGKLKAQYHLKDYGIKVTEKMLSNNTFSLCCALDDDRLCPFNLSLNTSVSCETRKTEGSITVGYKKKHFNMEADMELDFARPKFSVNSVFSKGRFLAGADFKYSPSFSDSKTLEVLLSYMNPSISVRAHVINFNDIELGSLCKVTESVETGMIASFGRAPQNVALCFKHKPNDSTSLMGKVNSDGVICFGCSYHLQNVSLSLSTIAHPYLPDNKLGIGLQFNF